MNPKPFLIGGKRGVQERVLVAHRIGKDRTHSALHESQVTNYESRNYKSRISISGRIGSGNALIGGHSESRPAILEAGAHERGEKRMRRERLRFEFRMKLAAKKPRVVGCFDDFDVVFVGGAAGDAEAGVRQSFLVIAIEFVAVAVAFADFEFAVSFGGERAGFKFAGPRA